MSKQKTTDNEAAPEPASGEGEPSPARFDEALGELENLVETLEQGDLSLDESLAHFERGVGLARECRASLQSAEQKVQILLDRDAEDAGERGDGSLEDFEPDRDES
ncbi:exodeoxyribonuclease VII small subunit [Halofilum ochraceum]|uniref:exodeoxyribonuclease VII small subunit n=1 Tax=Halofilum ochraceum TaxID=1611323 RepID=UPI000837A650|nr:exodeoxyribonuclease VII small subunit [Halofilum ochraceum]